MNESLGRRVVRGLAWSGLESFGSASLLLATSIILARLISPGDFGLIAVLDIFVSTGLILIESGFSTALIRLKNRTHKHEETVLACNLAISLLLYAIIFLSAPFIATFYKQTDLTAICRILGLILPINATCVVQQSKLTAEMKFGKLFAVTGISIALSSTIAITMACFGVGVWALVTQQLALWGIRSLILWTTDRRILIKVKFHHNELKELFGFGWKLLIAAIINNICVNLYAMIIGKVFNVTQAGLFTKAQSMATFPAQNGTDTLQRVSYPAISSVREDLGHLNSSSYKLIGMSSWIMVFIMFWLAALSHHIITFILGEQWIAAVPYFAIICIGYAFYPIHAINLNILNAMGRSDLFLRLELVKAPISILSALTGAITAGVEGLCIAFTLTSIICLFINGYYSHKYIQIEIKKQLKILIPIILSAATAACIGYLASSLSDIDILAITYGLLSAIGTYILISYIILPQWLHCGVDTIKVLNKGGNDE